MRIMKAFLRSSGSTARARLPAYALAVAITLAALGGHLAFAPWLGDQPILLLFVLPILLSAYLGGAGPGLASTAVVALGATYFLVVANDGLPAEKPVEAMQWLILIASGLLISLLCRLRRDRSCHGTNPGLPGSSLASERKVQRSFGLALVLLVVLGAIAILSVSRLREQSAWETHTRRVISSLRQVLALTVDVETAARGYILAGTDDFLPRYHTARTALPGQLQRLRIQTADNPDQQRHLDRLEPLITLRLGRAEQMILLRREQGLSAVQAAPEYSLGKQLQDEIRALISEMEATEQALLLERGQRAEHISVTTRTIVIGGGTFAFVFVALALYFLKHEFAGRHRAEAALHEAEADLTTGQNEQAAMGLAHDELESRVAERTADLSRANHQLYEEVAERRRTETALLEAKARTESVLAGMTDIYFVIDPEWHYLYANEAALSSIRRTSAVTPDQVLSHTPWELFPAMVGTELDRQFRRTMDERIASEFDFYHEAQHLWSHYRIFPVAGGVAVFASDITADKRAIESLRESEERFAGAFEHAPSGVALVSTDGRWLKVNQALCELVGYTEEELLAISFQQITHPDDLILDLENGRKLLAGEIRSYQMEKRYIHSRGHFVTALLSVSLVRDEQGQPLHFISQTQDITELRRTEEALHLLNSAVLQSKESILITNAKLDGMGPEIVFANPAFAEMTGYTVAEVLGRNPRFLQGPRTNKSVLDRLRKCLAAGEVFQGETINYRKDGTAFTLEWQIAPIRKGDGKITHFVAIQRDITQRNQNAEALSQSEELFRQVVENIDEVFWVTDPTESRIIYVSPAYAEIWGRSCESLCADAGTLLESIHPEDRARVQAARETKQAGGDYDERFRIIRPDGAVRWIHARAYPVRNEAGEIHRVVGVSEDITQYRVLEEQFRQTQKMEAIGTLAGGIAHDFNNILAAINGYTELAQMKLKENPEIHKFLGSVLQASSRAADLIRQILAFSRQQPLERRPIRLHSIVAESLALLRATLPTTIEFDTSLETDAPTVLADATQVHQILMNLGTNAWHAMRERPGRLRVALERCVVDDALAATQPRLNPGVYTRISVGDTGVGMDLATQRRIFEPFFTTKQPGEGTGLGLAVVHGIMDSHDGAITLTSQPGKGTVFQLYFPELVGATIPAVIEKSTTPCGQGQRILVVDDEELLAQLGRMALIALGYEAEYVTQSATALAMISADPERFALVLTDQTMPGMTGLVLASKLQEIRPGLPTILMTGYSASLSPERLHAAGIHQLLLKPATLHALGTAVHTVLAAQPAR